MNAFILAIGNEFMNGDVADSNSAFLERELSAYAVHVKKVCLIPDDPVLVRAEIRRVNE